MKQGNSRTNRHRREIARHALPVLILALSAVTSRASSSGWQSKCDMPRVELASKSCTRKVGVIVQFGHNPTVGEFEKIKSLGADLYRHLDIIHAAAATVDPRSIPALAQLPFVTRISADETVKKTDLFTVSSSGADVAYSSFGLTGYGVGVAILDSGIQDQPDFSDPKGPRIKATANFTTESPADNCGHGTHVAGIVGGNGQSSSGKGCFETFYGIARRANLVEVKVLNRTGQGTVSQAIAGIQWTINNAKKFNIRVLNISFGHPVGESYMADPLCQAVEQAWFSGIVVVCAAGNDGRLNANPTSGATNGGYGAAYGTIECPGNDPYVITVGAMKQTDSSRKDNTIATYSSRGPTLEDCVLKPDIVAAGNQIISVGDKNGYMMDTYGSIVTVPTSLYTTKGNQAQKYERLSGTSMAAPVVSGAAALLIEKNPSLTPDMVKARLMASADKWADPSGQTDPCTYGAGYLDIPAALASTLAPASPALSPGLSEDSQGNVYVDISNAIWGNSSLWGTGLTDLRAVWGEYAIWGSTTNLLSSSNAIWGKAFWTDDSVTNISSAGVNLSSSSVVITGDN